MNKIVARFKKLSRWSATPLGFRSASDEAQHPQMLLIASITEFVPEDVNTIIKNRVDAVMLNALPKARKLGELAKSLGNVPFGLRLHDGETGPLDTAIKAGCDFTVISPASPSAILKREGIARIVEIKTSFDQGMIRTIDALPMSIDAVFFGEANEGTFVTVEQLLFCQRFIESIGKPFVLALSAPVTEDQINTLWQIGVDALSVYSSDLTMLGDIRKAIDGLPRESRKKKPSGQMAILPRAVAVPPEFQDDEEEEDD